MNSLAKWVAAAVLAYCPQSHSQTPSQPNINNLAAYVAHQMEVQVGVERMVPPGWSIRAHGVAQDRDQAGHLVVQVHIFITGAPPESLFKQKVLPVGEDTPKTEMQGISAGKDGILMCAGRVAVQCGDPKNPDDPIEFTLTALKGEPFRYLFESSAGTIGIVIVPDPVVGKDGGCTLSAVRLTNGFELASITGEGYPPNADIHYTANPGSAGERIVRSNGIGVIRFSLIPYAEGKKSGTMTIKVTQSQCSPEISYDWGTP